MSSGARCAVSVTTSFTSFTSLFYTIFSFRSSFRKLGKYSDAAWRFVDAAATATRKMLVNQCHCQTLILAMHRAIYAYHRHIDIHHARNLYASETLYIQKSLTPALLTRCRYQCYHTKPNISHWSLPLEQKWLAWLSGICISLILHCPRFKVSDRSPTSPFFSASSMFLLSGDQSQLINS